MKNQITTFINHKIWEVRLQDRRPLMAFLFKQLRIIIIVSRNFTKDKLQVQAAGLTYYTLLSVVPIVALAFAIAKGFGFEERLEGELQSLLKGQEAIVDQIMLFATRMLENTQGGILAGVGVLVLLWSVLRLLMSIELSFNDIFQVASGRPWIRKFTEYFSMMLVAPLMIIISSSITVLVTTQIESLVETVSLLEAIGPFIFFLIKLIPYVLIWLVFTLLYVVMPNTKVNFGSAFIAGMIAGTAFQFVEWGYIHFQVGVSKYNAIYGSFAALPLFLIWVNISWLITLIGAEIAYANQYVGEIKNEIDGKNLSISQKHIIAMMICKLLADNYENGQDPDTAQVMSDKLGLPFGVTSKVLEVLVRVHLVIEVETDSNERNAYVPSRNLGKMQLSELMSIMNGKDIRELKSLVEGPFKIYIQHYEKLLDEGTSLGSNMSVIDLPWPIDRDNSEQS